MASTTFISLTNKLLRRVNEVEIDQSDFTSARGVQFMAKDAINATIQNIQQAEFTWPFNASTGSQLLVVGQEEYDWSSDLKLPKWNSLRIAKDDSLSTRGHPLSFISRNQWEKYLRDDDEYSGTTGLAVPLYNFEKHGFGFGVSPSPDKAYTVTYEYWITSAYLSAYDDTSSIPDIYDEVIIQGGLYHVYMFRDNREQAGDAEKTFKDQLENMRSILINKEDKVYSRQVVKPMQLGINTVSLY